MALLKIGKIQQGGGNAHSCHWLRESHDLLEAMRFSAPVLRMNKLASHPDGLGEKKKRAQVRDVQTNRRKDPPPPETALKKVERESMFFGCSYCQHRQRQKLP